MGALDSFLEYIFESGTMAAGLFTLIILAIIIVTGWHPMQGRRKPPQGMQVNLMRLNNVLYYFQLSRTLHIYPSRRR